MHSAVQLASVIGSTSFEVQLASVIGSTSFEDTERGIRFADEELLLMPDEMRPAIRFDEYLSTDMLEDLLLCVFLEPKMPLPSTTLLIA